MSSRPRFFRFSVLLLSTVQMLSAWPAFAAPPLSGTYKLTENTDLGSQVRITIQFSLMNTTSSSVTVTKLGLPLTSGPVKQLMASSSLVLHSHSSSQVSVQFLLAKKDFETWYLGPHQQFFVTFKSSNGKYTLLDLPLLRTTR